MPAAATTRPKQIEVINHILAIVWEDGTETFIDPEPWRRGCPCAVCQGETNVLSHSPATPQHYTPASFEVRDWEYIGGYAIQPHWADGHGSGIYSFKYLRDLGAKQG